MLIVVTSALLPNSAIEPVIFPSAVEKSSDFPTDFIKLSKADASVENEFLIFSINAKSNEFLKPSLKSGISFFNSLKIWAIPLPIFLNTSKMPISPLAMNSLFILSISCNLRRIGVNCSPIFEPIKSEIDFVVFSNPLNSALKAEALFIVSSVVKLRARLAESSSSSFRPERESQS